MKPIPKKTRDLVLARIDEIKKNPERLLDWDIVSKDLDNERPSKPFDAKKFNGTLKVNDDALVIQRRIRSEWERKY